MKMFSSKEFLEVCREKLHNLYAARGYNLEEEDIYVVWYCKTLQNKKALFSTVVSDGMYYEFTYNGNMQELYMDSYAKQKNVCFELKEGNEDE